MIKELGWLVGIALAGMSLLQLATNTRLEARSCAIAGIVSPAGHRA